MSESHQPAASERHALLWPLVGALLAIGVWASSKHAYFVGFLLAALSLPMMRSRFGHAERRGRFDLVPLSIVLGLVLAHGLLPFSEEVEIAALLVVGGAFPFHLWLEALQPRLPSLEFLALIVVQSGLALAVQILGPQTAMLDPAVRTWLAGWFVATAVIHSGLSLVRRDPLRAIFAIGLSQSSLLVAGGIASAEGFAAEELMLAGTNLGLISLVLILDDLRRRFGLQRLAPDNALAAVSPTLSRLFLVAGWLFVGLPGGIVFFAEDLVFHTLLERSTLACIGMILASVLNGICFYRVYLGVFSGRPRPVIYALGEERPWLAPVLVGLAFATILLGLWPQLLLAQLH